MYIPTVFQETRTELLDAFLRDHSFATLISHGANGVNISHLPIVLDESGTNCLAISRRRTRIGTTSRMAPP